MKIKRAVLSLTVAALLVAGPDARPAVAQNDSRLTELITATSYIAGVGFAIGAIFKFKAHKDNPQQVPVGTPVSLVFVGAALLFLPSVLNASMSCPVFVGSGTLLGEDSCAWSRITGETGTQGSTSTQELNWRVGGQFEVGPGWFLGGVLGTGTSSSQTPIGPSTTGQTVDAAVVVKRVDGPLFLAAALGLSNETAQINWPVSLSGGGVGAMTSNTTTLSGGLLLRGAYEFMLDPVYVRPRVDLALGIVNRSGIQESGPAAAVTVDPSSQTGVQITPMLEVGGRADVGSAILRPYVAAGPTFLPDNRLHLSGSVAGTPYSGDVYGTSMMANLEAGVQVYQAKSWEAKLEYKLTAADQYLDQSLGLRLARHF